MLTIGNVITRDEGLFEYLHHRVQLDIQTYQPGQSRKAKAQPPTSAVKPTSNLLHGDWLRLETKYKSFNYISDLIVEQQPISFVAVDIPS